MTISLKIKLFSFLLIFLPLVSFCQSKKEIKLADKIMEKLLVGNKFFAEFKDLGKFDLDSVAVIKDKNQIQLHFNTDVTYIPLREHIIAEEECRIKEILGWHYRNYKIALFSDKEALVDLVPNYYRSILPMDSSQFKKEVLSEKRLYTRPYEEHFEEGLDGKHLALWHSHGRYYESKLDRWEWQRARIHSTVEDLFPMSFVVPYLSKMLENAGAITLIPRERDIQKKEVIVDNDPLFGGSELLLNQAHFNFEKIEGSGFRWKDLYYGNENPFRQGSYLEARSSKYPENTDSIWIAKYIPLIPEDGDYALYISYGPNQSLLSPVIYEVNSQSGRDVIHVDQSIGAQTWIYLGHYHFKKGKDVNNASIIVYTRDAASVITLDAIKLGGGMGNIARKPSKEISENKLSLKGAKLKNQQKRDNALIDPANFKPKISKMARYMEAARYFLQYSGMPDSLVYDLNKGTNDYNDDYQARGEWVNYLMGNPNGPSGHRNVSGLGIPIDLSFAFHTDAGISKKDTIIGTLAIYSTESEEGTFPNGRSKKVNRELSDIIQSQIVSDIKKTFNHEWTRRGIWDKAYSEAYRANIPTMLLELLSHQNLADMNYGLDPRFRFLVSRSIYKGILKFLSFQENRTFKVQPLAPDHFSIDWLEGKKILLTWSAVIDSLETSAVPEYYNILMREQGGGFKLYKEKVQKSTFLIELADYGKIYSFKIEAVNSGGKSFPSETLSVGLNENSDSIALIVNAFDRVCGPSFIDENNFAGLTFWEDQGVADRIDFSTVGHPYDFDRNSIWIDDDSPGWGASNADLEGRITKGNEFDYPFVHGQAIFKNGLSFVSASDEFFELDTFEAKNYAFVDLIFGEEKSTINLKNQEVSFKIYNEGLLQTLDKLLNKGIPVLLSGAYIGSELHENDDSVHIAFARDKLHFKWRTNHADNMGSVYGTDKDEIFRTMHLTYNAGFHPEHYTVEAPDAIEAVGENARSIFRYKSTNSSAGVAYSGKDYKIIALGFPFESILSDKSRTLFMKNTIDFFRTEK